MLNNKVNEKGLSRVKLLSIKWFDGTRSKLKGFLSQIQFKVIQEKAKIGTPIDQVIYTGLFLTRRALKWFKPYLTEIQTNKMTTLNQEVKYIFLNWEEFTNQLIQIYGDIKAAVTAERRLSKLMQKKSTTEYTMTFQTYTT